MTKLKGNGTEKTQWVLKTPPGTSDYEAWRDTAYEPPALVVQVEHNTKSNRMRAK